MSYRYRSYNYIDPAPADVTPKRPTTTLPSTRSKPKALLSLHSPLGSRRLPDTRPTVTFAPSPKPFSRHLEHLRQSLHRRDHAEGWVDEGMGGAAAGPAPEAPRKVGGLGLSPRQQGAGSVARRLFASAGDERQAGPGGASAAAAARIAYLRETLRIVLAQLSTHLSHLVEAWRV